MLPHEMYVNYVTRRKTDLSELKKAYDENNLEPFKRLGHQIKGNAASFGFNDLAQMGIQMEEAATTKDKSEAAKILSNFEQWIQKTELSFK